eukprot:TRINITY_DN2601_c1_g4_i1.p1 TRINITY_DN2601_c1_g4~~TRINITY_DN2601_c1_g4_i1.p1  ORF type:complete len:1306 (-),score=238.67 TRINITY_DN2601_c1_g4_i1:694-4611(-)
MAADFPIKAVVPKAETQALHFVEQNPRFDGRGVIVAILDTGVDPGAPGLQITSDGKPKIIDLIDGSGSGDVEMSVLRSLSQEGTIEGLNGRKLKIPQSWNLPTQTEIRVGTKRVFQLFPKPLISRMKAERKKIFDEKHRDAVLALTRAIASYDSYKSNIPESEIPQNGKFDLEARLEQLKAMESAIEDVGPICDVVLFRDPATKLWRAAIDTTETGDFSNAKLMGEYKIAQEFSTFSDLDRMNYSFCVYDDGNTLSIVTNAGSHGTHVAGIVGANYPEQPELNGVAPGCQIVGIKIGDSRLGSMETGTALVRAFIACRNLKVDLINMSYGEPSSRSNTGRVLELANQLVWKHGVIFVASAGNNGPCHTTVGAPGGLASGLISVGAMVSPGMMDVQYSLRDTNSLQETQYTWSSRGPSEDGGLGVCISAPGGAITSVPNWTLHKSQLMNGTSMSSPNACGCLALVLSGLKNQNVPYSPALVRQAIENTARPVDGQDKLTHGAGVIQVTDSFEWLSSHGRHFKPYLRLEAAVTAHNAHKARGIYLRESDQSQHAIEETIEIRPIFHDVLSTNDDKLAFEMRITISTDAPSWISVPSHFVLLNENRTFKACIDPTKLPTSAADGSIHFAEIVGHDSARPDAGPIFRVPVTVVKPRKVLTDNSKIPTAQWNHLKTCPGTLFRKFIEVPLGASWAEITVECTQFSTNRLMVLAAQSIQHPKVSTKFTLFDKYLWMQGDTRKVERIDVVAGRTLELLFGQYWSSLGDDGELSVTIQFRGLSPDTQCLTLTNYEEIGRVNVRALCNGQETLAPRAVLCSVQRPLYPTSSDLRPLSLERDGLDDGKVVYQMILSYTYQTDDAGIQIIPRVPNLSEVLYDSPFEAQFWMIHEAETKRLIGHGDAWPDWLSLPTKGKYTISVQLRHDDPSVLEKMKNFPLLLERQLSKDKSITLSVYNSHYNAISGGSKFPSSGKAVHDLGHEVSFFVAAPTTGSVPAWVKKGDTLLGVLQISKVDGQAWEPADLVGSESKGVKKPLGAIKLCFSAPPKPKNVPAKSNNANSQLGLQDQLSKYIVDHISTLVNQSKFEEAQKLLARLKEESTLQGAQAESFLAPVIPGIFKDESKAMKLVLAVLELKIADGLTTDPMLRRKTVTAAAQEVISRVDRDALAVFFGMRRTPEETADQGKQMEEQKKFLLDALKRKALSLLNGSTPLTEAERTMLNDTISDIRRWVDLDSGSADFNEVVVKYERSRNNLGTALRLLRKELGNNHSNILSKKSSETLLELLQALKWHHLADAERRNQLARFPQGPLTMF